MIDKKRKYPVVEHARHKRHFVLEHGQQRKRKIPAGRVIRHKWLSVIQWIVLSIIPARLASIAFLGDSSSSWLLTAPGTLLLGIGLARLFRLREGRMLFIQYQHLLGFLSTRLSAGVPLEAALVESVNPLKEQMGSHNLIVRSLLRLRKNLEAQMSLNEALSTFAREVNLPVCSRDFTMLILLARMGGRIDIFVRQSHHDLSAQINTQNEVANERRGNASEALILSIIPFFMARFILSGASEYSQPLHDNQAMIMPLGILYLAAMLAFFILLLLLAPEKATAKKNKKIKKQRSLFEGARDLGVGPLLSRLYLDWLPGQIGITVSSAVRLLTDDLENAWMDYMARKTRDLLCGLLLAVLFALSGQISWFVIAMTPFSFSTLRDIDLCSKASKRKEHYRFYYPSVVNSLYILMESGLTLDRSLRMVAHVNLANTIPDNPVTADLNRAALHLETGSNSIMAASRLAERCPLPEVQAALRLMARYEREGGREILELIRMQADRSRQLYRDAMRGRAEQRSLLYVVPMAIDLLVVMATVILPAIVSMQFYV